MIRCWLIIIFSSAIIFSLRAQHVRALPATEQDIKSTLFSVTADSAELPTMHFKDFHYTSFEQAGPVEIRVRCKETIDEFSISPIADYSGKRTDDHTIAFSLPQSAYVVVTINRKLRLFVFGEAKEEQRTL